MKLIITREQSKALLGGAKFELHAKVELTPEEEELVKKYKAHKETLLQKKLVIPFTSEVIEINYKIGDLIDGHTTKLKNIVDIIETETTIREAVQNFKNVLDAMRTFGGRDVIEIN